MCSVFALQEKEEKKGFLKYDLCRQEILSRCRDIRLDGKGSKLCVHGGIYHLHAHTTNIDILF
jgi:hypothetical protein